MSNDEYQKAFRGMQEVFEKHALHLSENPEELAMKGHQFRVENKNRDVVCQGSLTNCIEYIVYGFDVAESDRKKLKIVH